MSRESLKHFYIYQEVSILNTTFLSLPTSNPSHISPLDSVPSKVLGPQRANKRVVVGLSSFSTRELEDQQWKSPGKPVTTAASRKK